MLIVLLIGLWVVACICGWLAIVRACLDMDVILYMFCSLASGFLIVWLNILLFSWLGAYI